MNALVTGGGKGIGLEISRLLLEAGHTVHVLGRRFDQQLPEGLEGVKTIEYDLTDIDNIPSLVQETGSIDILINNPGFMYALDIADYTAAQQERIIKVNLEAPVELIKNVLPHMKSQSFGRIVNIGSVASRIGHPDIWYTATKAGLASITTSLSRTLSEHNITVNAILPGPVKTEMVKYLPEEKKTFLRKYVNVTGEYLEPRSIAELIPYFINNKDGSINGCLFEVNNGVAWQNS